MRNGYPSINPLFDCGLQTGMAAQNFLRAHQDQFHSSLCGEVTREVPNSTGNQVKVREIGAKATENKKFMKLGLQKYIESWRNGMAKCKGFAAAFGPYVDY